MHDVVLIAVSAAVIIDDRMFSIILQISLFFIFQVYLFKFLKLFFNHELHELNEFIAAHNNRIYNKSHE